MEKYIIEFIPVTAKLKVKKKKTIKNKNKWKKILKAVMSRV